jgi:7-carboxy-7-deazaguanine synthase
MEQTVLYSEIFKSIQGEGHYTGVPTVWLRMFGCNLECNGFGQDDPTNPDSYVLPFKDFDLINVKTVEELPVWKYGCDSSYSWSKKFAKIQKRGTPEEVAKELFDKMYDSKTHIAFTGGEPMMKAAQKNIVKIIGEIKELYKSHNEWGFYGPKYDNAITNITFETNGTRPIADVMKNLIVGDSATQETEYFFSVSPKMFHTSGEKDAVCPEIVKGYQDACGMFDQYQGSKDPMGQLKFVCNGSKETWNEIEESIIKFRDAGVMYPIWIMPVGATEESQDEIAKEITIETMERGYNVAARVHCYIFGNQIGT